MKNIGKFLGIIALLLIIGIAVSCEVDPEDQCTITFTDIPSRAYDLYAYVELNDAATFNAQPKLVAKSSAPKQVRNGKVTVEMVDYTTLKAFGKEGGYFINLRLYTGTDITETPVPYAGTTSAQKAIKKGDNTYSVDDIFIPSIITSFPSTPSIPNAPPATNLGTYTTSYTGTIGNNPNGNVVETVVLTATAFNISDNAAGTSDPDLLSFRIDSWESAAVPSDLTGGYTGGYKFTGKILAQKNYVPSLKTAPTGSGFSANSVATDVKADGSGTTCWMYIYFKGETGSITFVRSAFSKTGGTENKSIVTGNDDKVRVYTKQ